MSILQIKKGNLIKIPQSSILYEYRQSAIDKYPSIVASMQIKEPQIGIYLTNLDDNLSEIILEDKIFVVTNNNIFLYKEERNVN